MELQLFLRLLDKVKPQSQQDSYIALCPSHMDETPSLSISRGNDGRLLLKCHAGCAASNVMAAVGLRDKDMFPDTPEGGGGSYPSGKDANVQTPQGLSLERYAEEKGFDYRGGKEFLSCLGLTTVQYLKAPAIRIPYKDTGGNEIAIRFRCALDGPDAFRWRKGDKPRLYGLWRLNEAHEAGYIVVVEGESDAHTLWWHQVPAIGLPGANGWVEGRDADYLMDIPTIYVVIEPDQGGEAVLGWLSKSKIRDHVRLVRLEEEDKDPSALYIGDPDGFLDNWQRFIEAAQPWGEYARDKKNNESAEAWSRCGELAKEPDILSVFVDDLAASGIVGETKMAKLLYLILTSRLLDRVASAVLKGPSSAGKSWLMGAVLRFFPPESYYELTSMSERVLAYSDEPLAHRHLVLYEAAGVNGSFSDYLLRSLLSEGRIRYETVEKTADGLRPRLIEREGPTGLLMSTTAVKLHNETESRVLSIPISDTPEQTALVLQSLANEDTIAPDLDRWHALQLWLGGAENLTTVPFGKVLAENIPPVAVRLRRDFGQVLNLIRSHAVLHQVNRSIDSNGRIVATLEDYSVVRALVKDLIAEGVESKIPQVVRETYEAVKELTLDNTNGVTNKAVASFLKVDTSAAYRRIQNALNRGHLKNLEDKPRRPARLVPGDPLTQDLEILPDPEVLNEFTDCTIAVLPGGITPTPPPPTIDWRFNR